MAISTPDVASQWETKGIKSEAAEARVKSRWQSGFLIDSALLLLWIGGCAVALYLKRSQLLIGFDGGYMRGLANTQFEWRVPYFSASADLLQGLGDVFFPVNFTWFPAFNAAQGLDDQGVAPVAIYVVVLTEITFAILFFARCLGASRRAAVAAAILTVLMMFPFSNPSLIYGILSLSPMTGTSIAAALAMGGAFLSFGRANWAVDLASAALFITLLLWSVLSSPSALILSAPFLLLCGVSSVLAAASPSERWRKVGLFLAAFVIMLATGPALYLISLLMDTAAATFPLELANDRASFMFASILFHWATVGPAGPILVGLAVAGAALSILDRQRQTLRIFAITLLTYLGSRLTFAVLTIIFDFWRGPSPLYFEFFVIPLYAIFASVFLARSYDFLRRAIDWRQPAAIKWEFALVSAGVLFAMLFASTTRSSDYGFPYPPKPTPFTAIISQEAGIRAGALFRGRTANMTGQTIVGNISWLDLHGRDGALSEEIGNEMRMTGLRAFDIPSLFEYGPTITPAFYALTSRLLATPRDHQMRSVSVLRNIDWRILEMLGVRFVITDAPIDVPTGLRATLPVKGGALYLYETERPNLGDYSPTLVRKPTSASELIGRLADPAFDPAREVIADIPGDAEGLVPATNARLGFDGVALHVAAESASRSILLLPIEFSRCLKVVSTQAGDPLVFRADLLETGILFSGRVDVSLALRTGPFFLDPGCRLRDYFDMRALKISEVPPGPPFALAAVP